jgi:hypothetical protein
VSARSVALTAIAALVVIHMVITVLHAIGVAKHRAGALVGLSTFAMFAYGQVANQIRERTGSVSHPMLLVVFATAIVIGVLAIARSKRQMTTFGRIVDRVAVLLVVMAGVQAATGSLSIARTRGAAHAIDVPGIESTRTQPDIFFLVFDRYTGASTLRTEFGHDIDPFLDRLRSKGFYVADESQTNVAGTKYSLSSSMNLEVPADLLAGRALENDIYRQLQDHRVGRNLKALGYDYTHIGPAWRGTGGSVLADRNVVDPWEFPRLLYASSMAWPIGERFLELDRRRLAEHTRFQMDEVMRVVDEPRGGPRFVFAHLLLPHPPMMFDAEGGYVSAREEERRGRRAGYVEQVRFLNSWITRFVDDVVNSPTGRRSIVILQADEGAIRVARPPRGFTWQKTDRETAAPFLHIFNAVLLPDGNDRLYQTISPVNTFRVIFDEYFGADLGLLPDESYTVVRDGDRLRARKLP